MYQFFHMNFNPQTFMFDFASKTVVGRLNLGMFRERSHINHDIFIEFRIKNNFTTFQG